MIKIKYPANKNSFHKKYIETLNIKDDIRDKFNKFINKNKIDLKKLNSNLDNILLAPFEKLCEIALDKNNSTILKQNTIKEELKSILDYEKFQPKIKSFFEKELKIKTCHYCNITFINTFNDIGNYLDFEDFINRANKKELMKLKSIGEVTANKIIMERVNNNSKYIKSIIDKEEFLLEYLQYSHFTLDHALDKAEYPLVALSLYNFVPSCYACNSKFKHNKKLIEDISDSFLSPTSEKFSFDKDVKFKIYFYNRKNIQYIKEDNYILDFDYLQHKKKYKRYIDTFKLKGRYTFHKNEAIDLIGKKIKYSQSQLEEISSLLKIPLKQLKKDIFGKEIFEDNLENFSMVKFKKDIAKNIGIL